MEERRRTDSHMFLFIRLAGFSNVLYKALWTSTWERDTYRINVEVPLMRTCRDAQTRQIIHCHTTKYGYR